MSLLDDVNNRVVITKYETPVDPDIISSVVPSMRALWVVTRELMKRQGFASLITDAQAEEFIDQELEGLKSVGRTLYVVTDNDAVVGYLSMRAAVGDAWISNVYISDDYRGKGIGKKLLTQATFYAKQQGCKNIALNVISNNVNAYMTYSNLGFRDHAIVMNKPL